MTRISDDKATFDVYQCIKKNPGLSCQGICTLLSSDEPHIKQVLGLLENQGKIDIIIKNNDTCYYSKRRFGRRGTRQKRSQLIRENIFTIIQQNPGLNLSQIAQKLDMSPQLAEYHLLYLQRNNKINSSKGKDGFYRRFYIHESTVGAKEKEIVELLRQEYFLKIILHLLKKPDISHKQLAAALKIHPTTLSYHLNRLDEYGILEAVTFGKEKGYHLKNRSEVVKIIRKYIVNVLSEGFRDIWEDLDPRE